MVKQSSSVYSIFRSMLIASVHVLAVYMHDILGGSNPTAKPITGLLGNTYGGQVPFAKPIGFLPPQGGVPIPNANGALPTVNGLGPDGLGLGFGTITIIDDILTTAPELGSQNVGKAQGVYVASSADGSTQMMAFTAMIEGGEYGDTLNFYGVFKIGSPMSHLSVTGGTGKFKSANGFAEVRSLIPPGQYVTDGAETLLRIIVHLSY
ncbi:hypothetical protein M0R45_002529 [Rubus argutus]|uniref:Dirigent protein n=1 Tax=Rubus argutus TaxID=59490 RepID=A0AAW1VRB1_RUBAR